MAAVKRQFELKVGIYCEGCVQRIEKTVRKIDGVDSIKISDDRESVVIIGSVHPHTVITTLKRKLNKKAELLWEKPYPPPPPRPTTTVSRRNRSTNLGFVPQSSNVNAVNTMLNSLSTAAVQRGGIHRIIPELRSMEIRSSPDGTDTLTFHFNGN